MWETVYRYAFIFFLFAFLGWCMEVAFAAVKHHRFVNRGFLGGPVCPIYGFGVLLVYVVLGPLRKYWVLLFLASTLLTSALEFAVGFLLDRLFHNKWWDYSDKKCNLFGYICLQFSLIWGALCMFVVKVTFTPLDKLMALIPVRLGLIVEGVLVLLILADTAVAVAVAIGLNRQLSALDTVAKKFRTGSDKIGEKIFSGTTKVHDEYLVLLDKGKGLKHRMVEAFPSMRSRRYNDQLLALRERFAAQRAERKAKRYADRHPEKQDPPSASAD